MLYNSDMRCEICNSSITENDYFEHDGMCYTCHSVVVDDEMEQYYERNGSDSENEPDGLRLD